MNNLEYILLVTSVAVEKGKIGKRKLAKALAQLASASHRYENSDVNSDVDASLAELHKEWSRRFNHLMHE